MDKNPRDAIMQATQSMLESAKDVTSTNIIAACRAGELKIDGDQIQRLLSVINSSIEEGHNRAARSVGKVIDGALVTAETRWANVNNSSALEKLGKKK